ncbi:hypothetical protein SKAU_G00069500 [Synaphobranchus kaupii]|uniref:Uncharacterized protein n=1 Tax=Synaphobranchus kaupii TaxID=118154 RepID=A0A9Q1G820_SYNKA|nr:hypothetical protein SKAU_G00069500 [Synaphobranchus kaupii]
MPLHINKRTLTGRRVRGSPWTPWHTPGRGCQRQSAGGCAQVTSAFGDAGLVTPHGNLAQRTPSWLGEVGALAAAPRNARSALATRPQRPPPFA